MKFEVGREAFNDAVNKVFKGVGNMGIFTITTIIGIEGKDGDLILTSTDNARNLEVRIKDILPKDAKFYTATKAVLLKALVNKTDSATITLEILEDRIVFNGGCSANLEIILNDEDTTVGPAKIRPIIVEGEAKDVKVSDLKMFLSYLKATLAVKATNPEYTAYRVKNNMAMTYDTFGSNLIEIGWDNVDILVGSSIVNLFDLLDDEIAHITVDQDKIKIETDTVTITGALRPDVAKYNIDRFANIIYSEQLFNTEVVVDKQRLLYALDRISLFVDKDDSSIFSLEVSPNSMLLLSVDKNFVEKIDFESSTLTENIQRLVGLETFKASVSSLKGDKVVINFGKDGGFRMTENKAYLVVPYAKERK